MASSCNFCIGKAKENGDPEAASESQLTSAASDFLWLLTAPQRIILIGCDFGENNFRNRRARITYHCYFLLPMALMTWILFWNFWAIYDYLHDGTYNNTVDMYGDLAAIIIYIVRILITFIFLTWLTKMRKFSAFSKMFDGDDFKVLNQMIHKEILQKNVKRKYIALSYFILLCYLLNAMSDFLIRMEGTVAAKITLVFTNIVGDAVMGVCLSLSVSIYIFTAAIWHMFNEEIKKEMDASVSSRSLTNRELMKGFSDCYDCLTEFTGFVAEILRHYNIVFVAATADFIFAVYATVYLYYAHVELSLYWMDIAVQFSALFVAAFVYKHASRTAELLYRFQKKKASLRQSGGGEQWPGFRDFYHRVAHEWAPTKVDVLGVIPITFTTVGVLVFTGLNWIAIILQFRQAEPSCALSNSSVNNGCICEVRNGSFGSISNYSLNQLQF